jgi:NTE family protein
MDTIRKPKSLKKAKIAFGGSGFLAPIHSGAFCAFVDSGYEIVEVAGTSGGSIVAAMIAAGLSCKDLQKIAMEPLPKNILSIQYRNLFNFRNKLAINDGNVLYQWILDKVGEDVTFEKAKLPIHIVSTDIRGPNSYVFSKKHTPHIPLALAARASSAVPYIFSPVKLSTGELLVDGGECNNIPVSKLSRSTDALLFGIQVFSPSTLKPNFSVLDYTEQHITALLGANEGTQDLLARTMGADIIKVYSEGYNFLNAHLTSTQKEKLYQNGYNAVKQHLKKYAD